MLIFLWKILVNQKITLFEIIFKYLNIVNQEIRTPKPHRTPKKNCEGELLFFSYLLIL